LLSNPGFVTCDFSKIETLAVSLKENGFFNIGMHSNKGSFFSRKKAFIQSGFDEFFDEENFSGDAKGWDAKDIDFYEQAVDILKNKKEPFFVYLISMQSHGPFENHNNEKFGIFNSETQLVRDYIRNINEVDRSIEKLFSLLKENGILKKTLVIIVGDHGPFIEEIYDNEIIPLGHHIPCVIYCEGIEWGNNVSRKVTSSIDIAPTILDILSIDEPSGWLGSSMLDPGYGRVILNQGQTFVLENSESGIETNGNVRKFDKFIDYSKSKLR
jgi:lipoteichoic acid synthase